MPPALTPAPCTSPSCQRQRLPQPQGGGIARRPQWDAKISAKGLSGWWEPPNTPMDGTAVTAFVSTRSLTDVVEGKKQGLA